jgi:hypothetical protein
MRRPKKNCSKNGIAGEGRALLHLLGRIDVDDGRRGLAHQRREGKLHLAGAEGHPALDRALVRRSIPAQQPFQQRSERALLGHAGTGASAEAARRQSTTQRPRNSRSCAIPSSRNGAICPANVQIERPPRMLPT